MIKVIKVRKELGDGGGDGVWKGQSPYQPRKVQIYSSAYVHVVLPWCDHSHSLVGSHGDGGCQGDGPRLLPAEPAPEPLGPGHDPIGRHAQGLGRSQLGVVQPLGGAEQFHLPLLPRGDGNAAMGLQVEVVLAPHVGLPLQRVLGHAQGTLHVPITDHPLHLVELVCCYGILVLFLRDIM